MSKPNRTKYLTAYAFWKAGFDWVTILNEPQVRPLSQQQIEVWIKQRQENTPKDCEIEGCNKLGKRKYYGKWRCKQHFAERKAIAGKANKKRKKNARKQKKVISEAERRKRIFASWKDPELDKLRITPEYKTWRIAVLERDDYTCQHCQKTGGRLHAHHKKTFKMNPELRYRVDNGITLCKQCHEDLHIANVDRAKTIRLRA